jgi:hypothetical protein
MKVVDKQTFFELPSGTIYSKGKAWYFSDFLIKGNTIYNEGLPIDWFYLYTNWPEDDKAFESLEKALITGESFKANRLFGRDGLYDPDDLFLIYEKDDLDDLLEHIENGINLKEIKLEQ